MVNIKKRDHNFNFVRWCISRPRFMMMTCAVTLIGIALAFRINISLEKLVETRVETRVETIVETRLKNSSITPRVEMPILSQYKPPSSSNGSAATFIFLMGVEGSGHHLYQHLFKIHMGSGNGLNQTFIKEYDLHEKFHPNPDRKSLYSAPCNKEIADGAQLFDHVVKIMKKIDSRVRREKIDGAVVPLNAAFHHFMNSYPSLDGDCRPLQYPDLDLTYRACEKAGVDCRHIMVYRDPYEIIRSTTMNRSFNIKHRQIKLMSTMLDVINTQMLSYPENLYACWSYNKGGESILDIGELLGWDNDTFMKIYGNLFVQKPPLTDEDRAEIIPPELQPFMSTMIKATARTESTCNMILRSRER